MKTGEIRQLIARPAFGQKENYPPNVSPDSTLVITMTLYRILESQKRALLWGNVGLQPKFAPIFFTTANVLPTNVLNLLGKTPLMIVYFRLLKESFSFAMNALRNNKLRTILSLLGVTIGIFSDHCRARRRGFARQKNQKRLVLARQKYHLPDQRIFWPNEVPRWKMEQFPKVTYDEYTYLKSNLNHADYFLFPVLYEPAKHQIRIENGRRYQYGSRDF